jgi:hypothetical protein
MTDLLQQSPFSAARERRIVILVDWLPPDFGAVGQYMQMRARVLAERGHDVTLVGLSTTASSRSHQTIGSGSLVEIRLSSRPVPRGSLAGRLAWTLWTNLRLVGAAASGLRTADGVLFTGSPPFLIHFLAPLKPFLRGRLVYRITDFHPECVIAAQERPSLPLQLLLALTNFWRRRIDGFEVLGNDQRIRLRDTGIPEGRIALVRDRAPVVFLREQQPEALPSALAGYPVLLYSGNYGIAHDVETVAEGYRLHHQQGSGRVRLWLNATGTGADVLSRTLEAQGLSFHASPPVALERLPGLLLAPHGHLISLKDRFVGYVVPSKVYGCLETAKPVIFVGSELSDVHLLASSRDRCSYWRVDCGRPSDFAAALEEFADRIQ